MFHENKTFLAQYFSIWIHSNSNFLCCCVNTIVHLLSSHRLCECQKYGRSDWHNEPNVIWKSNVFFAFSHLLGSTIRTSIYSQLIKKTNYLRSIFCLGAKWKTSSWMRTRRMFKISTFGRIFHFRARCFLCAWEENWIELYDSINLRSNCYVPTSSSIQFESQWN